MANEGKTQLWIDKEVVATIRRYYQSKNIPGRENVQGEAEKLLKTHPKIKKYVKDHPKQP